MLCWNMDGAVKQETPQVCFAMPASNSMGFPDNSLPLISLAPYEGMKYSPDGFPLQCQLYYLCLLEPGRRWVPFMLSRLIRPARSGPGSSDGSDKLVLGTQNCCVLVKHTAGWEGSVSNTGPDSHIPYPTVIDITMDCAPSPCTPFSPSCLELVSLPWCSAVPIAPDWCSVLEFELTRGPGPPCAKNRSIRSNSLEGDLSSIISSWQTWRTICVPRCLPCCSLHFQVHDATHGLQLSQSSFAATHEY